ncbi:MAG: AAA family ATPase [Thiomargarita sp.]|nr:AAA family ATPase [Thiomargarita sp.]
MSIKLPYGISNFSQLMSENYYYVDHTAYIEKLEEANEPYIFFLRPRRFGKSLFVSMLWHYYGLEFAEQFAPLFGHCYIGEHPTPKANSYAVLYFEFSRIDTTTRESTFEGFLRNVVSGVHRFLETYTTLSKNDKKQILRQKSPESVLVKLFESDHESKIYILIDEYDHFANEIMAFNFDHFSDFVSRNGFVRKFYEAIKEATGRGIVTRFFATGVTPITLDSLTSGFNIAANLTTHFYFHEMMGFTESETSTLLKETAPQFSKHQRVLADMKKWYNGYLFAPDADSRLYNPDMVLYFLKEFAYKNTYPRTLIDINIASDYGKIRRLFRLGSREHYQAVLEELIETGCVEALLTQQFSFEKPFDQDDFISLLFYLGLITIRGNDNIAQLKFSFPNYVIKELYWAFFLESVKEQYQLDFETTEVRKKMTQLAQDNNIKPFVSLTEKALTTLSNRDFISFDEKYVKALFVGFASLSNLYFIKSEPEMEQKYPDILFLYRQPYAPNYQFLFELKYLKKKQRQKLNGVRKDAINQIKGYKQFPEIQQLENLKSWVIIFVGEKAMVVEEV